MNPVHHLSQMVVLHAEESHVQFVEGNRPEHGQLGSLDVQAEVIHLREAKSHQNGIKGETLDQQITTIVRAIFRTVTNIARLDSPFVK